MQPWVSKIVVIRRPKNDIFVKVGWQICGHMSPFLRKRFLYFSVDGSEIEGKNRKTFKVKLKDWRV